MTDIWEKLLGLQTQADLRAAIAAQFPVVDERLVLAGRRYDITRIADPDSLLDDGTLLTGHDQLAWHPYWAQIWDAALGVGWELLGQRHVARNVLDLGCGLGIAGAVAASMGAHVTMVDQAPPALCFARLNSWPWRARVEVRRFDWRADDFHGQFDLIIGADILYDRDDLTHLDRFWRQHAHRGTTILLGDPARPLTGNLLDRLPEFGWRVQRSFRTVPGLATAIRLVTLEQTY